MCDLDDEADSTEGLLFAFLIRLEIHMRAFAKSLMWSLVLLFLPAIAQAQMVEVERGYVRAPFVRVYRTPDGGTRVRAPFVDVFSDGPRNRPSPRGSYELPPSPSIDGRAARAQFRDGSESQTRIHHPRTATHAVRLRVNGQDTEISPGETLSLIGQERPVSVQLIRPNGRYGFRRALSPGDYVFSQTRRGWTLVLGDVPSEPSPAPIIPFPAELTPPSIEQLPTPNAQPSLDTPEASVLNRSTSSP
jgi:hypothetical protein